MFFVMLCNVSNVPNSYRAYDVQREFRLQFDTNYFTGTLVDLLRTKVVSSSNKDDDIVNSYLETIGSEVSSPATAVHGVSPDKVTGK